MFIKELNLKNFRNYEEEKFEFDSGINIITGANAQGKTNVAEAVFYLSTGYSPRASKDKIMVRAGAERAEISGKAQTLYGELGVKIKLDVSDKKELYVNGLQVLRIGEFIGNLQAVFFNPAELKLVQESPEDRRRFLNVSLCQQSKSYFYALARYNKILLQRNNLLKNPDRDVIRETLPVWDKQLTDEAGKIIKARNEFLEEISPIAQEKHALISSGREELSMKTENGYYGEAEEIAYAMFEDLKTSLEKDMRLGYTSIGPHRDDVKFILNGMDARVYGSQGQQRTVALALKLAETEIFKKRFSEYPVLILDDVLSELDKKRQRKLFSAVEGLQTIFTATGVDSSVIKSKEYKRIVVENGKVKR